MSLEGSNSGSSSNTSPNHLVMFQRENSRELTDLTLFGSAAPLLSRTGTVRRASSGSNKPTIRQQVSGGSSSPPLPVRDDNVMPVTTTVSPETVSDPGVIAAAPQEEVYDRTKTINRNERLRKSSEPIELIMSQTVPYRRCSDQTLPSETATVSNSNERYRKSLDSTYRLSLESISEYKAKSTFSTSPYRDTCSSTSMESSTSSNEYITSGSGGEYALRASTLAADERTIMSPASSYLSWIESVNSEYFTSATSNTLPSTISSNSSTTGDLMMMTTTTTMNNTTADDNNKVGEWNSFWLNYNSARSSYLATNEEEKRIYKAATDPDCFTTNTKSNNVRDMFFDDRSNLIVLSADETNEAIRCSQRITEILQNALQRNDMFVQETSHRSSFKDNVQRQRSASYTVGVTSDTQQTQQKTPQSASNCINTLLSTTGVAEILRKVITKRRDFFGPDETASGTHHCSSPRGSGASSSYSDWSSSFAK